MPKSITCIPGKQAVPCDCQAAPGQPWAYAGYKLTVYSNLEEKLNDLLWWDVVPKARPVVLRRLLQEPEARPIR